MNLVQDTVVKEDTKIQNPQNETNFKEVNINIMKYASINTANRPIKNPSDKPQMKVFKFTQRTGSNNNLFSNILDIIQPKLEKVLSRIDDEEEYNKLYTELNDPRLDCITFFLKTFFKDEQLSLIRICFSQNQT